MYIPIYAATACRKYPPNIFNVSFSSLYNELLYIPQLVPLSSSEIDILDCQLRTIKYKSYLNETSQVLSSVSCKINFVYILKPIILHRKISNKDNV